MIVFLLLQVNLLWTTSMLCHTDQLIRIFLLSDTFPLICVLIHMHLLQEVSYDTLWSTQHCKAMNYWNGKQNSLKGYTQIAAYLYFKQWNLGR